MELRAALAMQGNSLKEADEIISSMVADILDGADPEVCLEEQGLEPDYVLDLLSECQ